MFVGITLLASRCAVVIILLFGVSLFAAPHLAAAEPMQQPPELLNTGEPATPGHSQMESILSIGVLVFGGVILLAEIAVTLRQNRNWDAWSLKHCGLTLVIVSGLFLIVAGYSDRQSAPMMGLLGSVAGYLLGQQTGSVAPHNQTPNQNP